ncbi:MAG: D-Ala-D-Ala carboxypeptidase family metallohydrolase [Pseudomonadota bacterium]
MQLFYRHWSDMPGEIWDWPSFRPWEIACNGTGAILVVPPALFALQRLRADLAAPVALNSAYRSPSHNRAVGGATWSKHLMGIAFDVKDSTAYSREDLIAAARRAGFTGFGNYPTFLHIDLGRPRVFQ